jgi:2-methylcitrate dehydratase PrpD
VGFKGYATAGAIHASLWALDDIMREQALHAEDIGEISVRCTSYCQQHVGWTYAPRGVAAAQLNLYYALAVMALDRAAMIEQFREERLADPRILAFIPRIRVTVEPRYDALGNPFRYALHMTVRTTGGATYEREIMQRPGSPQNPLSAAQLRDKFALLASYALTQPQIDRVAACVDELEQLPSVVPLAHALTGNEQR